MKIYLVTGGAGFIGSNFILYMFKKYKNIKVINIDKLTYAGNLINLQSVQHNNNYIFVKGDICDVELIDNIFRKYNIDYVVNFAAETHVDRSIKEPEVFAKTNILGTVNLLNASKKHWSNKDYSNKKFLQISTDEVYGSLDREGYFFEESNLDSRSPYSSSKASADIIVKSYCYTYGLPINITRCTNNYGPYQFLEKFIPLIINNCLNGKNIPLYGDGTNIRDWIYVEDHCRAIDLVLEKGIHGQIYNIGANNERENIEVTKLIIENLNRLLDDNDDRRKKINNNLITYVKDRLSHDKRYAVDSLKIRSELGWEPKIKFEEGIINTIKWYLDNEDWIRLVTGKEYEDYYKKMYNNM